MNEYMELPPIPKGTEDAPWPRVPSGWQASDIAMRRSDARVGALIFTFSINTRVYGSARGAGMIYEHQFSLSRITGENRASWILDGRSKVVKKGSAYYGLHDAAEACWLHENRWRIAKMVERADYPSLRLIQGILGEATNGLRADDDKGAGE
jgi:hypothetical protein